MSHTHRGQHQQAPLMNLALFNHRQFAMGSLVSFIYGTALFGSTYLLPVYLRMDIAINTVAACAHSTGLTASFVIKF